MQKIDCTLQQKGAQTAEQTFALTRASSACGGYFDLMLKLPRLDCSFPFAFFLACRNATCSIRGGTDGRRLMHQRTEHVIGIGTHRSSLSRTDVTSPVLRFAGIVARVETWHAGNFVPIRSQRVRYPWRRDSLIDQKRRFWGGNFWICWKGGFWPQIRQNCT